MTVWRETTVNIRAIAGIDVGQLVKYIAAAYPSRRHDMVEMIVNQPVRRVGEAWAADVKRAGVRDIWRELKKGAWDERH